MKKLMKLLTFMNAHNMCENVINNIENGIYEVHVKINENHELINVSENGIYLFISNDDAIISVKIKMNALKGYLLTLKNA